MLHRMVLAVLMPAVSAAQADIIHVDAAYCPGPGDGSEAKPYCSIQVAIDNAVDADEIVVAPGTYFETINTFGKAITLRSSDGPHLTIIDGQQAGCVVQCGAFCVETPILLEGFTITGGHAANWGGGLAGAGMFVSDCRFLANHAEHQGGGVAVGYGRQVFTNCTFEGNTAGSVGGGLWGFYADTMLIGCTFVGNVAHYGGALAPELSDATAIGCTFTGNIAGGGDAVFFLTAGYPAVVNCIVWGNSPNQVPHWVPISFSCVQGGFPGAGNIDTDPLFVDPDHGDLRLSPGSPCIDAGHNNAISNLAESDLDGHPRVADDPATDDTGCGVPVVVDMGAYEYQGVPGEIQLFADLNGDGVVTVADLFAMNQCIGSGDPDCCMADLDADGAVGITDRLLLLSQLIDDR